MQGENMDRGAKGEEKKKKKKSHEAVEILARCLTAGPHKAGESVGGG